MGVTNVNRRRLKNKQSGSNLSDMMLADPKGVQAASDAMVKFSDKGSGNKWQYQKGHDEKLSDLLLQATTPAELNYVKYKWNLTKSTSFIQVFEKESRVLENKAKFKKGWWTRFQMAENYGLKLDDEAQAKILDAKLASLESRKHEDPAWAELPEMIQYYDEQVLGLETSLTRRSEQEIQRSGKATAKDFEALQNGQYTAMGLKMIDDKFEEQKPGAEEVSHGKKLIMKQPNS